MLPSVSNEGNATLCAQCTFWFATIIDIILSQYIAYRGHNESAYNLNDETARHGNFLAFDLFLAKYDAVLKQHVTSCKELSQKLL